MKRLKRWHFILVVVILLLQQNQSFAAEKITGKTFTNSLGMNFVQVPAGEFLMGVGDRLLPAELRKPVDNQEQRNGAPHRRYGDFDEWPRHPVAISKNFYLAVTEVTNAQYEAFDPAHREFRGKHGFSTADDEAVVFVNWYDAVAFCDWLSRKEGRPYRLPTEAEWEYACRAGTVTPFHTGDTLPAEFIKNAIQTWYPNDGKDSAGNPIRLFAGKTTPNNWGLYDLHGNVEEWCWDWYGPYPNNFQTDPVGYADGDFKVTRGGSHSTELYYLRSANRMGTVPEDMSWLIGFRVVLGEMPTTKPLPAGKLPLNQQNVNQTVPADLAKGPDPTQPFFKGPRKYVKIAPNSYGPLFYRHNHDPAIVECPNGDLLATWYTCVTEKGRELGLAASRLVYGAEEWQPASVFWDAPDRNDHAPALWFDGENTLFHFVGLAQASTWGSMALVQRTSSDNGRSWSRARLIMPEHAQRHMPVESVIRTRTGHILLPSDDNENDGTILHISKDNGETWQCTGGTIAGIHAGVVQLKNGDLMAFGRGQNVNGKMPKSISKNMGKNWSVSASPFPPISGGQRLVLIRLAEGPLFLASFAGNEQNPEEKLKIKDAAGIERLVSGLFAALSYDDGKTWPVKRLISDGKPRYIEGTDGRLFLMNHENAEPKGYLAIAQTLDGVIHLISSQQHYAFNLKWVEMPTPAAPK